MRENWFRVYIKPYCLLHDILTVFIEFHLQPSRTCDLEFAREMLCRKLFVNLSNNSWNSTKGGIVSMYYSHSTYECE